jgi:alpha-1,6-mannosyltransferase
VIRVRGPASPYDPSYHLLLDIGKIRRIIARERPDVLEIHSPYMAAFAALGVPRTAYGVRTFQWHSDFIDTYGGVLEAHVGRTFVKPLAPLVRPAMLPLWALVRAIGRRCDATLVASRWQVDKLTGHGVPNVVHRPFGIERSVFRPDTRSSEARAELLALAGREAGDRAPILVGMGRFAIEKRWDVVLDAFALVRARGQDAVLVLFGDGPELQRMRERAARTPFARDVAFPGFAKGRAALAKSLASADAFVHGCPFETFGLSVAEALASGLPTVLPDEGGAAELHDATSGERYASLDPAACAHAIERLLRRVSEEKDALRTKAAAQAASLPTVIEQFEAQLAIYERLLRRDGA